MHLSDQNDRAYNNNFQQRRQLIPGNYGQTPFIPLERLPYQAQQQPIHRQNNRKNQRAPSNFPDTDIGSSSDSTKNRGNTPRNAKNRKKKLNSYNFLVSN